MFDRSKPINVWCLPALILWAAIGLHAGTISPHTRLHVNLGPVPIDKYTATNYDSIYGHGYVSGCSTTQTVRACYQQILANFHQQGVEGIRFMFYFCGGGYSTALNGCGAYNGTSLNTCADYADYTHTPVGSRLRCKHPLLHRRNIQMRGGGRQL